MENKLSCEAQVVSRPGHCGGWLTKETGCRGFADDVTMQPYRLTITLVAHPDTDCLESVEERAKAFLHEVCSLELGEKT